MTKFSKLLVAALMLFAFAGPLVRPASAQSTLTTTVSAPTAVPDQTVPLWIQIQRGNDLPDRVEVWANGNLAGIWNYENFADPPNETALPIFFTAPNTLGPNAPVICDVKVTGMSGYAVSARRTVQANTSGAVSARSWLLNKLSELGNTLLEVPGSFWDFYTSEEGHDYVYGNHEQYGNLLDNAIHNFVQAFYPSDAVYNFGYTYGLYDGGYAGTWDVVESGAIAGGSIVASAVVWGTIVKPTPMTTIYRGVGEAEAVETGGLGGFGPRPNVGPLYVTDNLATAEAFGPHTHPNGSVIEIIVPKGWLDDMISSGAFTENTGATGPFQEIIVPSDLIGAFNDHIRKLMIFDY